MSRALEQDIRLLEELGLSIQRTLGKRIFPPDTRINEDSLVISQAVRMVEFAFEKMYGQYGLVLEGLKDQEQLPEIETLLSQEIIKKVSKVQRLYRKESDGRREAQYLIDQTPNLVRKISERVASRFY